MLLVAWCLMMAVSAVRQSWSQQPTGRAALEAELMALVAHLPAGGTIGYVTAGDGEDLRHEAAIHTGEQPGVLHVAQYVLAPRIVRVGPGPEYVIVRRDAAADPATALSGYEPAGAVAGTHRVYRRIR